MSVRMADILHTVCNGISQSNVVLLCVVHLSTDPAVECT